MHLLNLPTEPIPLDHIVIKFIPPRRGRELGAWVFCQGRKIEAVDEAVEGVEGCEEGGGAEEGGVHFFFFGEVQRGTKMEMGGLDAGL